MAGPARVPVGLERPGRRFGELSLMALLVVGAAGCKKDAPAPVPTSAPSASASAGSKADLFGDLPFNPMADLGEPGADGGDAPPPQAAGEALPPATVTVKSAGAEPRAKLAYTFTPGAKQNVVATFKTSVKEDAATPGPQNAAQPPVRFSLTFMPIDRMPDGRTRLAAKVDKVELITAGMGVPKEAEEQIAAASKVLEGVSGTFSLRETGAIGDVAFSSGGGQLGGAMQEILPLLQQAIELVFVLYPADPIGVGAQWTSVSAAQGGGAMTTTYTLKERTKTGTVVKVDTERSMPAQAVPDPRAPPGATMEMKGKGSYLVSGRLDGPAAKASGEAETRLIMKDPSSKPPRTVNTVLKVQQTIEPGAAAARPDGG